ncbi:MAG: ABC transporter permease subunit [Bacillaceae bacterium]
MRLTIFIGKQLVQLLFTLVTLAVLIAFLANILNKEEVFLPAFWENVQTNLWSFYFWNELYVNGKEGLYLLKDFIWEPYVYSCTILAGGLVAAFVLATLLSFVHYMLPSKLQTVLKELLLFVGSIPDVMFIFGMQLFVIWIFKKTELLVVEPFGLFSNVYALPIFTLAIAPAILLFRGMILAFDEEKGKEYVEYAKAKGLSKTWILFRHIFRNALVTIFSNFQLIIWFAISNLLIIEHLFYIKGYFSYLLSVIREPDIFYVSLSLLFIPFYLLDVAMKGITLFFTGKERV